MRDGTQVTVSTWSACALGTSVQFFSVAGGGHTWPGGQQYVPVALIGRTSRQFSASQTSWLFFAGHART